MSTVTTPALRAILAGRATVVDIKRADTAAIHYIFCRKDGQQARLEAILVGLETNYWRSQEDEAVKKRSVHLLRAIAEKDSEGSAALFYQVLAAARSDSVRSMAIAIRSFQLRMGTASPEDMKCAAREWYVLEFFRFVAETLDRSAEFGLLLLENLSRHVQHYAADVPEIGVALEHADAVGLVLTASIASPPHPDAPACQWFHRLIRAAPTNPLAEQVVHSIVEVFKSATNADGLHTVTLPNAAVVVAKTMLTGRSVIPMDAITLPVDLEATLVMLYRKWCSEVAERTARGVQVLSDFRRNRTQIRSRMTRMRQAILTDPKRTLRRGGADHIEITVMPLYTAGIHSVVLVPDGLRFPDVNLRILTRKEVPQLIGFPATLRNLQLNVPDGALFNGHHDLSELRELLEYVVLDVLHRIIVEGRELTPKKSSRKGELNSGDTPQAVRGHMRKLRPGHQASPQAMANAAAEQSWAELRPGMTYVRMHVRSGEGVYAMPTEPVAIYSDRDLFSGLELV